MLCACWASTLPMEPATSSTLMCYFEELASPSIGDRHCTCVSAIAKHRWKHLGQPSPPHLSGRKFIDTLDGLKEIGAGNRAAQSLALTDTVGRFHKAGPLGESSTFHGGGSRKPRLGVQFRDRG